MPDKLFRRRGASRVPHSLLHRATWVAAAAIAGGAVVLAAERHDDRPTPTAQSITRELLAQRFTAGRFTGQTAWAPCRQMDTVSPVLRVACGAAAGREASHDAAAQAASLDALHLFSGDSAAAHLRVLGLAGLRFSGGPSASLRPAVELLDSASRRDTTDAGLWNDRAVAWEAEAERTGKLSPMLRALDAVEAAAARSPRRREILFNRALIMERLYLWQSAHEAWLRYLGQETDSAWSREGREHAEHLKRLLALPQRANSRDSTLALLGKWGTAFSSGDGRDAAALLRQARKAAIAEHSRTDRTAELAIAAVDRAATRPDRLQRLARAHAEYAAGKKCYGKVAYTCAEERLRASELALSSLGSPAAGWAAYYRAAALIELGHQRTADAVLRPLASDSMGPRTALAGWAVSTLGVSQVRRGNYEDAAHLYWKAWSPLARAADEEKKLSVLYTAAEALNLAAVSDSARAVAYRGLKPLSRFRRGNPFNNLLSVVAGMASDDSLALAALAIRGEVVKLTDSSGKPELRAWALRSRAPSRAALGDTVGARADIAAALRLADSIDPGPGRERVQADVRMAGAHFALPGQRVREWQRSVNAYRRLNLGVWLGPAQYGLAMAVRETGDLRRAAPLIEEAVRTAETQQDSLLTVEARAAHAELVGNVFDSAIEMQLALGDEARAFRYLERSRVTAWSAARRSGSGTGSGAVPGIQTVAAHLPRGTLLVEYALLRDRTVIWTASRGRVRVHTVPVSRDSVATLVARSKRERDRPAQRGDASASLYALLVAPFAAELRGADLVVVPDRALHDVPFTALWDASGERYLVEYASVRTVPSAAFFLTALAAPARRATGAALVVGDPSLAPGSALRSLAGATQEAHDVAALYPSAVLMDGADARRGQVLRALPAASIFHFAGHAVLDIDHPERSYLALAPDGPGRGGNLAGWEIRDLRLSNVRVAVLSACSTLGSGTGTRAGAVTGLAYSFLRAGVPGTVSTLWDVRDDETTSLLVGFHRELSRGTPAARALRDAQLAALRSSDKRRRAPRAWAAFLYTGP